MNESDQNIFTQFGKDLISYKICKELYEEEILAMVKQINILKTLESNLLCVDTEEWAIQKLEYQKERFSRLEDLYNELFTYVRTWVKDEEELRMMTVDSLLNSFGLER